ncbi:MAG: aspartate aminotransferase family protein, partial [Devosia sp.]
LTAPSRNYRDVARRDHARYVRFAFALLQRGVRILERGAWFVSSEHKSDVIDASLAAVREAAQIVRD